MEIELGITTFGETTPMEHSGETFTHQERIRQLIKEIELADRAGVDVYGVGEHHRADFAVSSPEMILSAGAVNTSRIKLISAVSVLSSSEVIGLYQRFATLDAISNGRAEIMVGKGSFTESFPLFGYNLDKYEALFNEKLQLLLEIDRNELLSWEGRLTHSVAGKGVYPRFEKGMPLWIATGGNPYSSISAAKQGLPITYAIIGGRWADFKGLIDLYRRVGNEQQTASLLKVASHSWGYIAESDAIATEEFFYPTKYLVDTLAKERPHWTPLSKEQYLNSVAFEGAMFVGGVENVSKKIIAMMEHLGIQRFMIHLPLGSMPHDRILNAIQLFGEEVAPRVKAYFRKK